MKVSLEWLKNYVELPESLTPEQIAYDLTMATVEVEDVIRLADKFTNMCVGQITEILPHPDADKLKIAVTDLGAQKKNIVCGGSNLTEGMYVAVARPGAKVRWHGEGDLIELQETKIRGQESFGMICASSEIGLSEWFPERDAKEIINLSAYPAKPGTKLSEYLKFDDVIFDIDNKSLTNRPDLWGHYGIARELSTIYGVPLKKLEDVALPNDAGELKVSIENPELCNRYLASNIRGVKVEASPFWMQSRLVRIGQRPINVLVDLTNYVMFSIGQPLHAFDARKIANKTIYVRCAKENETLTLLDKKELKLNTENLLICDPEKALALAGVMGGADSGIAEDTTEIILEAAHFNPLNIRKTATEYSLRTDSSMRFEKGIDAERAKVGTEVFIDYLKQIQPEAVVTAHLDEYVRKFDEISVEVKHTFITSRIGQEFPVEKILQILSLLGFKAEHAAGTFKVIVPSWRATGDVSIPEDVVEEVARMYGFDNLDFVAPEVKLTAAVSQPDYNFEKQLRKYLAHTAGFNEIFTYPWMEDKFIAAAGIDIQKTYRLFDPPAPDASNLKNSLLPNMLQAVAKNTRYYNDFALFELARIFSVSETSKDSGEGENLPHQPKILTAVIAHKDAETAYFKLKGAVEGIFKLRGIDIDFDSNHQAKCAKGNTAVSFPEGELYLLSDRVLRKADIKHVNVAYCEINFSKFLALENRKNAFQALPVFPEVDYELSVIFNEEIAWQEIMTLVQSVNPLIKEVKFYNQYKGKPLPDDKKSVSFNMRFADANATLTSEQVQGVVDIVLEKLKRELGGGLRN